MSILPISLSRAAFPRAPVRANDLRYIIECLRQGRCCALVGPSNLGKSVLLQSLLTAEVRRHCAEERDPPPVMVFVDCLAAEPREQAFHELLLRRLIEALEEEGRAETVLQGVKALYDRLLHSTDLGARSLFASSLRELGHVGDLHLVLILDEFDDLFRWLPPWPFRQLRALRDRLGNRLCYVIATSRRLEQLRSDSETYEFRELFHLHTRVLRPLSRSDVEHLIAYLARQQDTRPDRELMDLLAELSGGHPGLLECILNLIDVIFANPGAPTQTLAVELCEQEPIQMECQRLWEELEEEEREGLLTLVGEEEKTTLKEETLHELIAKGLITGQAEGSPTVFSPIFEAYVCQELARRQEAARRGLWYDARTRQVWLDDRDITRELSRDQYNLVVFLCQRPGVVCTKDEIVQAVWPDQGEVGVTDAQIYQLIKRVREKIEPDPTNPRYIVTVRGQGYRLEPSP